MNKISLLSLVVFVTGIALADTPPAPGGNAQRPVGPCRQIVQACRAAGFVRGQAKEGKGLFKNCVEPILAGQSVQGVSVDASVVQACQQRRQRRKGGNGGPAQPGAGANGGSQDNGDDQGN